MKKIIVQIMVALAAAASARADTPLAIGANSAIFTLANALIFASLPVPREGRLERISTADSKGGKLHGR